MPFIGNAGQFANIYEKNYTTTTLRIVEGDTAYQAYNPADSHYKLITDLQQISNIGASTNRTVSFSNVNTGFTTSSNVGIANTQPIHTMDIGSKVHIDENDSNTFWTSGALYADELKGETAVITNSVSVRDVLVDRVYPKTNGYIYSTSNVGIITSTPSYTLDVDGDINFTGTLYDNGVAFSSGLWSAGTDSLYYRSNVEVGTGNLFVDTTTSNVGIGSTTPSYTLDVDGDINFTGSLLENGTAFTLGSIKTDLSDNASRIDTISADLSDNASRIDTISADLSDNSSRLSILESTGSSPWTAGTDSLYYRSNVEVGTGNLFVDTTTSNVGVGSTTPSYTLDVVGDIHFSGNLYQNGTEFVSSGGSSGSTSVIAPVAFAFVDTTNDGSGTGISWGSWSSSNNTLDFTFDTAQSDSNYAVVTDSETYDDFFVEITNKTTTGFRAGFYDNSQSRQPSNFSPFTFIIYASTPTIEVTGGSGGGSSLWTAGTDSLYYRSNVEVGTGNLFVDTTTSSVGIGSTTPSYTLDVAGDINFTGSLLENGTAFTLGSIETDLSDNALRITTVSSDLSDNASRIDIISTDLSDNSLRIATVSSDLSDNASRIDTISTDLSDNSLRIATVSSDLSANASRIDTISTDLSDNSLRIATVSSDLSDNASRIDTISSDLSDNSLRIATVSSDLSANASRIDTISTDLSDNSLRIATVSSDLSDNASRIATVSSDLSDNASRIDTISTDLSDNSLRIATVSSDLSDNASRIDTISTDLSDNSLRIATVSSDLSDNASRIDTISSDLSDNALRITTVSSDLSDNASRIDTISSDLSDNALRITTISTDLTDNSLRINTISYDLADNSSRITTLESTGSPWTSNVDTLYYNTSNLAIGNTYAGYELYVEGNVYASQDISAFSDARFKENVEPIENALEKVCSIGGYTYNKIGDSRRNAGVLAQEVMTVLPEVVHGSEESNYSVSYGNIVGLLIEAIKELKLEMEKISQSKT